MTDDPDRAELEELQNRLKIDTQHVEGIPEYTPDRDHDLARALSEASLQYATAWAKASLIPCSCKPSCGSLTEIRNVLTGILLPSVIVAAETDGVEVSLGDLVRMAGNMADKMFAHARAAIGRPL